MLVLEVQDGLVRKTPWHMNLSITFPIEPTDDVELTCIFCSLHKCTHAVLALGDGQRVWCGMHEKCAKRHRDRLGRQSA